VVSENFSAVRDGKLTDSLRFSVYLAFMSRACTICQNPQRADIDRRLAGGEPTARIARDAGVSLPSLYRHRLNCLGLGSSNEIMKEIARGSAAIALLPSKENLSHAYSDLQTRIDKIVAQAQQQGSLQVALSGLNSIRATLDSLARLAGHLQPAGAQVNVAVQTNVNVGAVQVAERLIKAFDHQPEIKAQIAHALMEECHADTTSNRLSSRSGAVGA
jgi:carbon monoxide dehydrogenase subunit G